MQLDDLKNPWAEFGTILERNLAIDERLIREVLLTKVRRAFVPYVAWRALEAALGIALLLVTIPLVARHEHEARYVALGGALAASWVVLSAYSLYLLVNGSRLDYGGSVLSLQSEVERLQLAEYGAIKWAVLLGVVLWLPAALVLFEAVTGVPALARVDLSWLVANLIFGIVILFVGHYLSKKYVERADLGPWSKRIVDAVSGHSLRTAARRLAELEKFAQ